MIWTAISFNWSVGCTAYYVFDGPHSHTQASMDFFDQFPGENLLALIAGDHRTSTTTYPLLVPSALKLTQEGKDDRNT